MFVTTLLTLSFSTKAVCCLEQIYIFVDIKMLEKQILSLLLQNVRFVCLFSILVWPYLASIFWQIFRRISTSLQETGPNGGTM